MPDPALTLYQAEWCPFSAAVREVLTELGLDFAARQVEPWPEQRERLQGVAGGELIPVLVVEDGSVHRGTRAIFAHLREREPWRFAAAHRRREGAPLRLVEGQRRLGRRHVVDRAAAAYPSAGGAVDRETPAAA